MRRFFPAVMMFLVATGCAALPPLDDAAVGTIRLATAVEKRSVERPRMGFDWPTVHLSFVTRRLLLDSRSSPTLGALFFCDTGDPLRNALAEVPIIWRRVPITHEVGSQLQAALKADPKPQEYEILFDYVSWEPTQPPHPGHAIVLSPLKHDLCLSVVRHEFLSAGFAGKPLHIDRNAVTAVIDAFPRQLELTTRR